MYKYSEERYKYGLNGHETFVSNKLIQAKMKKTGLTCHPVICLTYCRNSPVKLHRNKFISRWSIGQSHYYGVRKTPSSRSLMSLDLNTPLILLKSLKLRPASRRANIVISIRKRRDDATSLPERLCLKAFGAIKICTILVSIHVAEFLNSQVQALVSV
jgi:hypothetical protein